MVQGGLAILSVKTRWWQEIGEIQERDLWVSPNQSTIIGARFLQFPSTPVPQCPSASPEQAWKGLCIF